MQQGDSLLHMGKQYSNSEDPHRGLICLQTDLDTFLKVVLIF